MKVARSFLAGLSSVLWLAGSVVIYSDATGQRPIRGEVLVGLGMLWLPVTVILIALIAIADRLDERV